MRRGRFGNGDWKCSSPRTLSAGSRTALPAGFDCAAADQRFSRSRDSVGHGIGKRAVEPPAGVGGRQARIDRLKPPIPFEIWD